MGPVSEKAMVNFIQAVFNVALKTSWFLGLFYGLLFSSVLEG